MDAGFRNGLVDTFGVFLRSAYPVNRRFTLLRLVGDHLTAPEEDRLLPAAPRVRAYRQKFQRASAQEVLCPYAELVDYLDSQESEVDSLEPTDELIGDAARHFDVSSLMVKTVLVNKVLQEEYGRRFMSLLILDTSGRRHSIT